MTDSGGPPTIRHRRRPGLLAMFFLLLAGCSSDRNEAPKDAGPEDKVLNVYNWSDYIGKSTIADFEAKTGIKVTYDVYDSNEVLETKLLTGKTGYDIVVPSGSNRKLPRQVDSLKLDSPARNSLGM